VDLGNIPKLTDFNPLCSQYRAHDAMFACIFQSYPGQKGDQGPHGLVGSKGAPGKSGVDGYQVNMCRGDRGYMLQGLIVTVAIFLERPLLDSQFIYRTCAPNS